MKFSTFVDIIAKHGFEMKRQNGSHKIYEGFVDGQRRVVTIACHRVSDEIRPKTFSSMIRQSGLDKELFKY